MMTRLKPFLLAHAKILLNLLAPSRSKSTVLPFLTKNLDFVLDNTMSMHQFVSHIAKSFYSQLHCISQI